MAKARRYHAAALLPSGKVLVTGGDTNNLVALSSTEIYDPSTGMFTGGGTMTAPRMMHAAVPLASGKVLLLGGFDSPNLTTEIYLSSAEIYDPGAGTFTATGSMTTTRDSLAATTLPSGKVLVAGGYDGTLRVATSEIYDPVSGTFVPAGSMSSPRVGHTLTLLGSGSVLAAGGTDGGADLASADLFKPLATGGACTAAGECVSGLCDHACCASACSGVCKGCAVGTGACGPVVGADDPDTCTGVHTCDATGACKLKDGQGCTQSTDCASGYCVDEVCCHTACTGLCQACAGQLKQSASDDGVCGNAAAGTNPHHDACQVDPPSTCGRDGKCDGAGACKPHYDAGTSCGPAACNSGNNVTNQVCGANGTCQQQSGPSCGNYACDGGVCPTACAQDGDCVSTAYCSQGACLPKAANGSPCSVAIGCASNLCADGVCCDTACDQACEACNLPGSVGRCSVPPGGCGGTDGGDAGGGGMAGGDSGGSDAGARDAGAGDTGEPRDGGTGGLGADSGPSRSADASLPAGSSGCGCRTAPAGTAAPLGGATALLGVLLVRRRRAHRAR
jgi:MYXO-CTERM domain-containing protein